mgnify:CR=1 FL=1
MSLLNYIRGLRKGKEAHRLEKEAMQDSFLADALDGYQQVGGNHEEQIEKLRMQVLSATQKKKNNRVLYWAVAACLLLGVAVSSYLLLQRDESREEVLLAQETSTKLEPSADEDFSVSEEAEVAREAVALKEADSVTDIPTKQVVKSAEQIEKEKFEELKNSPLLEEHQMVVAEDVEPAKNIQVQKVVVAQDLGELIEEKEDSNAVRQVVPRLKQDLSTENLAFVPSNKYIVGKVIDAKGEPLVGVSVVKTGTGEGVVTNLDGEFFLSKKGANKKITAKYIGFEDKEVPIDTTKTMLIAMNEKEDVLSEVVVVGTGTQKKDRLIGSLGTLSGEKLSKEKKEKEIESKPVIGMRKYKKYLKKNLIRPTDLLCKNVKGEVTVTFFVNEMGRPEHIAVRKSLCDSADKEAMRLIQDGPDWTVGNQLVVISVKF